MTRMKWWWLPLLVVNFLFWFFVATAILSVTVPLDVGFGDIR